MTIIAIISNNHTSQCIRYSHLTSEDIDFSKCFDQKFLDYCFAVQVRTILWQSLLVFYYSGVDNILAHGQYLVIMAITSTRVPKVLIQGMC